MQSINTMRESPLTKDFINIMPKDIKDKINLEEYVGIKWIVTDEGNLNIELEKKQCSLKNLTKYSIKGSENIDIVDLKKKVGRGEI